LFPSDCKSNILLYSYTNQKGETIEVDYATFLRMNLQFPIMKDNNEGIRHFLTMFMANHPNNRDLVKQIYDKDFTNYIAE
jgi:hypothetical protein